MLKVANAPCSWGVLEFDSEAETATYNQVLDEIQETGYSGTELGDWGFMPTDSSILRRELQQRDLALLGAFVPVPLVDPSAHDAAEAVALRTANLLASTAGKTPFIILADDNGKNPTRVQYAGRIRPEHSLSSEQWRIYARGAERIARAVRDKAGLRTVFHHHAAGYVETPAEVDQLLEHSDPELLGLCFDTGHYRFGGGDPVSAIKKYGRRIWHVHFKDFSAELAERARMENWDYFEAIRHGIFCELGEGDVDFPAVIEALRTQKYDGWIVVEQDVLPGMGTPKMSASRNRAYLQRIGL